MTGQDSDLELAARAAGGDAGAFVRLVERHKRLVLSLARQMTLSEGDAEDLAQETFLRAWKNVRAFRREASFKTWLVRILMNHCWDYRRSRSHETQENETLAETRAAEDSGPEERLLERELTQEVRKAVAGLPLHYRSVIVLRDFQDMSYAEISETLGIPAGTVMSRLSKAREQLRARLAAYRRQA